MDDRRDQGQRSQYSAWALVNVQRLAKQLMVALEFKDPKSKLTRSHHLGGKVQLPGNINKLVQDYMTEVDIDYVDLPGAQNDIGPHSERRRGGRNAGSVKGSDQRGCPRS